MSNILLMLWKNRFQLAIKLVIEASGPDNFPDMQICNTL